MSASKRPYDGWRALNFGAALLIAFYAVYLCLQGPSGQWLVNRAGSLNQTDFAEFWGAGRVARAGHGAFAYDWTKMGPLLGPAAAPLATTPFPFAYPPTLLLLLSLLSAFSPLGAATAWVIGGLSAYLLSAWSVLPRLSALLIAGASPALFCCLYMGQNGLFTAACLAGALLLLDRRPLMAGFLIGLLSCKPQLGVLIPFALAASGRWRVAAAAAGTVTALAATSLVVFGWPSWIGFLQANRDDQALCELIIHRGQSLYALLRSCGAPIHLAWTTQMAAALACVVFVVIHWRSRQPNALKAAGLIAATILTTPYSFFYDFPITTLAVLFILSAPTVRKLEAFDLILLFLVFAIPILVLSVDVLVFKKASLLCVGPAICLLLLAVVSRRWIGQAPIFSPMTQNGLLPNGSRRPGSANVSTRET